MFEMFRVFLNFFTILPEFCQQFCRRVSEQRIFVTLFINRVFTMTHIGSASKVDNKVAWGHILMCDVITMALFDVRLHVACKASGRQCDAYKLTST